MSTPIWPEWRKIPLNGVTLETMVRIQRDGVWYSIVVRETMHIKHPMDSQLMFERFIKSIYFTQTLYEVDPSAMMVIDDKEIPLYIPDKNQQSEKERLFEKYPHIKR